MWRREEKGKRRSDKDRGRWGGKERAYYKEKQRGREGAEKGREGEEKGWEDGVARREPKRNREEEKGWVEEGVAKERVVIEEKGLVRIMKRYCEVRGRVGVKKRQREKRVSQRDEWQGRRGRKKRARGRDGREGGERRKMERWEPGGGKRERCGEGGRGKGVGKRERGSGKEGWAVEGEESQGEKRVKKIEKAMPRRHVYQGTQESMAER